MAGYTELPPDDETISALLADMEDYVAANISGWQPSTTSLEKALMVATADEGATLYALLRQVATDQLRGFGQAVLGVASSEPIAAEATTTWTARTAAPVGGYTLQPGVTIAANSPSGLYGFEVVEGGTITSGNTTLTGVVVRAMQTGPAPNGASGTVQLADPPAWVQGVTITSAAAGGTDGETDDDYLAKVVRAAQQLSRSVVLPLHVELAGQEIAGIARMLVLDNYDDDTGLDHQERTTSVYPVDDDGEASGSTATTTLAAVLEARREPGFIFRVGTPTYTTVDSEITVARTDTTVDSAALQTAVEAAVTAALQPSQHGQVASGERQQFRKIATVRRYELASIVDRIDGVEYVDEVLIAADGDPVADADLALTGAAPLTRPGTVTVTVIDAA